MKNLLTFSLFYLICVSASFAQQQAPPAGAQQVPLAAQQQNPAAKLPDSSAYKNSNLTYNIIDAPDNTFGYDVFVDGKLMIHQTSIPAMPGNDGFKTKEDATKVAEMVMYKIRKGEMPPTVTPEEMKKLEVIK